MHISLLDNLIIFPVMDNESALVCSDIHRLVKGTPGCLCDYVVLRSCNLFFTIGVLIQSALEVIHAHIRFLVVIIDNEELLIP